jgi:hypothetical protein
MQSGRIHIRSLITTNTVPSIVHTESFETEARDRGNLAVAAVGLGAVAVCEVDIFL